MSPAQPMTALEKTSGLGAVTGVKTGSPSAADSVVVGVGGFSKDESSQVDVRFFFSSCL